MPRGPGRLRPGRKEAGTLYTFLYKLYRRAPLSLRLRVRRFVQRMKMDMAGGGEAYDPAVVAVLAKGADADDGRIVDRIVAAYRRSAARDFYGRDSMWRAFRAERHQKLHELLLNGPREKVAEALRNPKDYDLLYGFENLFREYSEQIATDPDHPRRMGAHLKGQLVRLGEAVGALRVWNPVNPGLGKPKLSVPELIALAGRGLGFPLPAPSVFADLEGLPVPGGVLTYRMIDAAYCAYRVKHLTRGPVLEIGAGVGFLAYHLARLGQAVTIVDLPMTNVAQGYFLMRALGEEAVVLEGESPRLPGAVNVLTPAHLDADVHYDLVVNVDSLTEVGRDIAESYLKWIVKNSRQFWSVNQEGNPVTVNEMLRVLPGVTVERFPYWMRDGYVEEVVTFR
jgi:hypothetical protein